jgi:hypothetical protein
MMENFTNLLLQEDEDEKGREGEAEEGGSTVSLQHSDTQNERLPVQCIGRKGSITYLHDHKI